MFDTAFVVVLIDWPIRFNFLFENWKHEIRSDKFSQRIIGFEV